MSQSAYCDLFPLPLPAVLELSLWHTNSKSEHRSKLPYMGQQVRILSASPGQQVRILSASPPFLPFSLATLSARSARLLHHQRISTTTYFSGPSGRSYEERESSSRRKEEEVNLDLLLSYLAKVYYVKKFTSVLPGSHFPQCFTLLAWINNSKEEQTSATPKSSLT